MIGSRKGWSVCDGVASDWITVAKPRDRNSLVRFGWRRRSLWRRSESRASHCCRRSPRRSSILISTSAWSAERTPTRGHQISAQQGRLLRHYVKEFAPLRESAWA